MSLVSFRDLFFKRSLAHTGLTEDAFVEEELPDKEADDNGHQPQKHFNNIPASAWVLGHNEREAVAHHGHACRRMAVGDRVLSEDEEVEEGHQASHGQPSPRMLEVVAETGVNVHPK